MIITPLGVNGWMPSNNRSTSSFLVEVDNQLIILDCGTGIYKLCNYEDLLNKYEKIDIILSHYHLDHIIGLSFIPRFLRDKSVTIWGPGKKYYDKSAKSILKDFTSTPYFSMKLDDFAKEVVVIDYDEEGFYIKDIKITINKQDHPDPSFGIGINEDLYYASDTLVIDKSFDNKYKLILHECWSYTKEESYGHSWLEAIYKKVDKHNIKNLGLIHLNPRFNIFNVDEKYSNIIFVVEEDKIIST